MSTLIIFSPLDQFEVVSLITVSAPIIGIYNLALTNYLTYILLLFVTIIGIHYLNDNDSQLILNKSVAPLEVFFATIKNIVTEQIGAKHEIFFPFIYAMFLYIFLGNFISNIPYNFAVNASAVASLSASLTIFLGVTILALYLHKQKFFGNFVPKGSPGALAPFLVSIETISYNARGLSLGVRLFSNLFSGHSLVTILSGFLYKAGDQLPAWQLVALIIPLAIITGILALEVVVSFIQAFVFTLLTSIYLKESIELH